MEPNAQGAPSTRATSHENERTGMVEVYLVRDGASGSPAETRLDSEWKSSNDANKRVRMLEGGNADQMNEAWDAAGGLKAGSDPNTRAAPVGGPGSGPTKVADTQDASGNRNAQHEDE